MGCVTKKWRISAVTFYWCIERTSPQRSSCLLWLFATFLDHSRRNLSDQQVIYSEKSQKQMRKNIIPPSYNNFRYLVASIIVQWTRDYWDDDWKGNDEMKQLFDEFIRSIQVWQFEDIFKCALRWLICPQWIGETHHVILRHFFGDGKIKSVHSSKSVCQCCGDESLQVPSCL